MLDAYVAVSPELRALASALGDCAPRKLAVIENGIDLVRFAGQPGDRQAARAALGIPESAWVIGSVGRLAPEKDYPLLVRACAPLLGAGARLLIVGDGSEAAAIRKEAVGRGVEDAVLLPGARDDVPRLLAGLDVFVISSRMEGLPLCSLEAMAAGLPVVATSVGGLPGLIEDGVTGYLVPPNDEEALRRRLVALRDDRDTARAVGERGRAHVRRHYSREAMVERYLKLYASFERRT